MCLVVLAIGQCKEHPLILAGNRDEFHERPTQKA
ncbi:MAG: NRDE family protein, partial [Gammaproteobacteria bacterium]|nr:NRDE family protein [Gammaproteobacteria bacterium]